MIKKVFIVIPTLRILTIASLTLFPIRAHAQVEMSMKAGMDEETSMFIDDVINRRVILSPVQIGIKRTEKNAVIEIHNPTKDTLNVSLRLSDSLVGFSSRFVYKDSIDIPKKKPRVKGLFEEDVSDSASYNSRPMSGWIINLPKALSLLPGEKKNILVTVNIPDDSFSEEYVTWVVAEVRPRKMVPEVKRAVYTISTVKLTCKRESQSK